MASEQGGAPAVTFDRGLMWGPMQNVPRERCGRDWITRSRWASFDASQRLSLPARLLRGLTTFSPSPWPRLHTVVVRFYHRKWDRSSGGTGGRMTWIKDQELERF